MKTPLSGARKVADGGVNDRNDHSIVVGQITKTVAREAGIQSGKIVLSDYYVRHITERHYNQIIALGTTPIDFVKYVVKNFNRIYEGSNGSFLLVVYPQYSKETYVVAIQLYYYTKKGLWEVATAQPRNKERIKNMKLKWRKK